MADDARLGIVLADAGRPDVEVHHAGRPGVGEVLRRGPDQRPAGGALHGRDGRGQAHAAEHEHLVRAAHADVRRQRQVPAVRIVRGAQVEEERIHGATHEPAKGGFAVSQSPYMDAMSAKTVTTLHPAQRDDIGDLTTRRPVPGPGLEQVDPFLFLNHHGPQTYGPGNRGLPFGPHPHRGFETVTFILEGELAHQDSAGHESIIRKGGVQWMTAGLGPHPRRGVARGLQAGRRPTGASAALDQPARSPEDEPAALRGPAGRPDPGRAGRSGPGDGESDFRDLGRTHGTCPFAHRRLHDDHRTEGPAAGPASARSAGATSSSTWSPAK